MPIPSKTILIILLLIGLLSEDKAQKALVHLKRFIGECDYHLRTGFLGTLILPFAVDKMGEVDLMYTILFKETYPSWFYSINQGATTTWERWDSYSKETGFKIEPMNSLNHYAYGAIGQWMYESIAGLKPLKPGYKEVLIAPIVGGPLTSAQASYKSPYGMVSSGLKKEDKRFILTVTISPNTTAKITIPSSAGGSMILDGKPFAENPNVKIEKKDIDALKLVAQPGIFVLERQLDQVVAE